MILNIRIENYRSFKNETEFTLVAESSKSKENNLFTHQFAKGKDSVRLLNTALIYGANASGKTNLLRCLFETIKFIRKSNLSVGESIDKYDPFKFAKSSKESPTNFSIDFIGKDDLKYCYSLSFTKSEIIAESLTYFPLGKSRELFSRITGEGNKIHKVKPGTDLSKKNVEVFNNQTILSKFGNDIPDKIISEVFMYLTNIEVVNACDARKVSLLKNEVSELLLENEGLKKKMNQLVKFADTGINTLFIKEIDEKELKFPKEMPENIKTRFLTDFKYFVSGIHNSFDDNNEVVDSEILQIEEESHGTKTLYSLGGIILKSLEFGHPIFIDELDTGLHPFLSKLLITLFQNKRINKKNAQLVFTTHDTNLLDRSLFRKDQFWFVEKNEEGVSDLYSLQDFSDVREDTPFDKWYMAGKFGGIPNIKSLESLFIEDGEK